MNSVFLKHRTRLGTTMSICGLLCTIFGLTSYKYIIQIMFGLSTTTFGIFLVCTRLYTYVKAELFAQRPYSDNFEILNTI